MKNNVPETPDSFNFGLSVLFAVVNFIRKVHHCSFNFLIVFLLQFFLLHVLVYLSDFLHFLILFLFDILRSIHHNLYSIFHTLWGFYIQGNRFVVCYSNKLQINKVVLFYTF